MDCKFLENSLKSYFEKLSSKSAVPGGGSVTAFVASLSSSLLNMVMNFTIGKKSYIEFTEEIKKIKEENDKILEKCMEFIEKDSQIYLKIDKAIKEKHIMDEYLKESVNLHLEICEHMEKIISFCEILLEKGNRNLISDTGISNVLAYSSFECAKINILINLKFLNDKDFKKEINQKLFEIEKRIKSKSEIISEKIIEKLEE